MFGFSLSVLYSIGGQVGQLISTAWGGVEPARKAILRDFFRHGFDGSGDDGMGCAPLRGLLSS